MRTECRNAPATTWPIAIDTTSPFTLSDKQFSNLLHLSQLYRRQALRYLDAKAYGAGSVMVGAALEAVLISLVYVRKNGSSRDRSCPLSQFLGEGVPEDKKGAFIIVYRSSATF
jgi:hypothetical protein